MNKYIQPGRNDQASFLNVDDVVMDFIPINIDLRSDTMPPQPLFIGSHIDHDLALLQIKRINARTEDVLLYNLIINGITVADRLFSSSTKLIEFLECLTDYSAVMKDQSQHYSPMRIAEFMAYHRQTEYEGRTVLDKLNAGEATLHSFSLSEHPNQLRDDLDYISMNSLSGNYAVSFK